MRYENLEEAKSICEDIDHASSILDMLERGPVLVGIKYRTQNPFLVIATDEEGLENDMARDFISYLKERYSSKITVLKNKLNCL